MASTDAKAVPVKNVAFRVTFPILDADGDLVTGATSPDSEVSKDGGAFADCTNEATEIATASGMYYLDLTSTEMNADTVAIIVKSGNGKTTPIVLYPTATAYEDLPTAAEIADAVWDEATSGHIAVDTFGAVSQIIDGECPSQAGMTSTQLKLAAGESATNDIYNGRSIKITAGKCRDQLRRITDYDGTTKIVTVATAWKGTPDNTSEYRII